MTNIKQVTELAGVSIKAVSRVLDCNPSACDITQHKVQVAIEELKDKPDMASWSMRTKKIGLIGMVTDHITTTPYAVDMIKGAQEIAWKYQKNLFIINTEGQPEKEETIFRIMEEHGVEGIIFATTCHRKVRFKQVPESINIILLNCFADDDRFVSIVPDDYESGVTAAMQILKREHKRVAVINIPMEGVASRLRLEGFFKTFTEAGNLVPEYDCCFAMYKLGRSEIDHTNKVIENLFNCDQSPTALLCGNDNTAMLVYNFLKERHFKIPDDVSVLGFDNVKVICTNLRPRLSTVALPHYEMGKRAVFELMNYDGHHKSIKVKCPFMNRESLRTPKQKVNSDSVEHVLLSR